MKIFRKSIAGITAVIMIAIILVSALPSSKTAAAPSYKFSVNIDYAFGNSLQSGYCSPFNVTVTNNGSDFEGSVQLYLEGENGAVCAYEQKLSLPAGATKTCNFIVSITAYLSDVNIRLVTTKGKEVYNQNHGVISNNYSGSATIGLLTDDYAALSYLSGKYFNQISCTTSLYRLNADSFPDNSKALDLLDVIIIANFATDSLSKEQISALMKWVNNGGLLMIATGDSAGKTLSGLDSVLKIKTGGLKTYKTTYGLNDVQFTYGYSSYYSNNKVDYLPGAKYSYSLIDFSKYDSEFKEMSEASRDYNTTALYERIYDDNTDIIIDGCWEIFFGDSFIAYSYSVDAESLEYAKSDFKEYAIDSLIPDFVEMYLKSYSASASTDVTPVDGIICELDFGTSLITGDSADGSTYVFAANTPSGSGNICVLAADITKTPFVDFSGNSALIIHIIETLAGQAIYDRSQNVGWSSGNYVLNNLFDKLTSQKLVPLLLYVIVIFAYVVVAFVAFFRFRKKGTSMLIWPFQAGLAVAVSLLIFLIGFSTREAGASVNTARIITDIDGFYTESAYTTALMPKVKHYELAFKDIYNVTESNTETSYYSHYGNDLAQSDYTICVSEASDGTTIKLNNSSAMKVKQFDLENKSPAPSNIDFSCTYSRGALSGHLTNNSEKTLEDAFICVDFAVFKIGKVLPGETIDLSGVKGTSLIKVSNSDAYRVVFSSPWDVIKPYETGAANILLGTDNKGFREGYNKKAIYDYVNTSYLSTIPGYGEYHDYISTTINGTFVTGNCIYVPAFSEGEPLSSLGIDENGFIDTAYSAPVFVAFTKNPEKVLRSEKDTVTEVIVLAEILNTSTNPDYMDSRWFSYTNNGYYK